MAATRRVGPDFHKQRKRIRTLFIKCRLDATEGTARLTVSDFNQDGKMDIVESLNTTFSIDYLYKCWLRSGMASAITNVQMNTGLSNLHAVGDFSGDGWPDYAVYNTAVARRECMAQHAKHRRQPLRRRKPPDERADFFCLQFWRGRLRQVRGRLDLLQPPVSAFRDGNHQHQLPALSDNFCTNCSHRKRPEPDEHFVLHDFGILQRNRDVAEHAPDRDDLLEQRVNDCFPDLGAAYFNDAWQDFLPAQQVGDHDAHSHRRVVH